MHFGAIRQKIKVKFIQELENGDYLIDWRFSYRITAVNKQEAIKKVKDLLEKSWAFRKEGQYDDAIMLLEEARYLCSEFGFREEMARVLAIYAQIERDHDKIEPALEYYHKALDILRGLSSPLKTAHTLRHIADIQREKGKLEISEKNYTEALNIYRYDERTGSLDLANAVRGFALLKEDMENVRDAIQLWEEARDLYQEVGVAEGVGECEDRIKLLGSG